MTTVIVLTVIMILVIIFITSFYKVIDEERILYYIPNEGITSIDLFERLFEMGIIPKRSNIWKLNFYRIMAEMIDEGKISETIIFIRQSKVRFYERTQ